MKPFSALATLGLAAHNGFERWSGVGVVLEPFLGRRATNVLWSVLPPVVLARSLRDDERDGPMLALNAGISIAGAAVHFVEWPWTAKFGVLPWLTDAEGLPPSRLPAYNAILWLWAVGGVGAALRETRRRHVGHVLAGVATMPVLLVSARHHFRWARGRAAMGDPHFARMRTAT